MKEKREKLKNPYWVMSRGGVVACSILTLLLPAGLLLIHLAKSAPAVTERLYSLGWYRTIAAGLMTLTSRASVSFMEIILLLLGAAALAYLVFWVIELIWHHREWWKICLKRLWILAAVCCGVFFYFVAVGDLNYYRIPVGTSLGLAAEKTDETVLQSLCELLAKDANTYRETAAEDKNGVFTLRDDYNTLAKKTSLAVAELDQQFGVNLFSPAAATRPKAMYFSEVMSYLRLTGVIFPYIMEANINVSQPDYGIPSTMCHELSHICGYMREDEANFISYLACLGSGDRDLGYSGTMLALIYSTNQLYRVNPQAWEVVRAQLSEAVRRDLADNSRYWAKYDTPVGDSATGVNDAYLKANDQADGVQSYGRMVDLLIAYYRAAGVI